MQEQNIKKSSTFSVKNFTGIRLIKHVTSTTGKDEKELYYYVNFDWIHIFSLHCVTTSENLLQSIQYQILNRFFPSKEILHCITYYIIVVVTGWDVSIL